MFGLFSQVQGWVKLKGATDGTKIGNTGDSLKALITASALPAGASTEATLAAAKAVLDLLNAKDFATQTTLSAALSALANGTATPALNQQSLFVRPIPYEAPKYLSGSGNFTVAASATDIFTISGSATKTIRVKKISVSGRTTSGSPVPIGISVLKRSTANTSGTSVTETNVPCDSAQAAATAIVKHYTANPTLGTTIGRVACRSVTFQNIGLSPAGELVFNFENPIVLHGTSEELCLNFNATSVTGSAICCDVEWEEV